MADERRILEKSFEPPGFLSEVEFPGPLTVNRILSLLVVIFYLYLSLIHFRFVSKPEPSKTGAAVALSQNMLERAEPWESRSPYNQVNGKRDQPIAMATLFFLISLSWPLFLIWYPEVVANWTPSPHRVFGASCDTAEGLEPRVIPTHTIFIQFLGWLYLVGIPLLMILLSTNVGP